MEHTATLRAHDGDDGVREAAVVKLSGSNEVSEAIHIEFAITVDQLRGAALVRHAHELYCPHSKAKSKARVSIELI